MCIICRDENIQGLQILYCSGCPLLTAIPQSLGAGLQRLYCSNCPLLTVIPEIQGLQELYCPNCPLLTAIPAKTLLS